MNEHAIELLQIPLRVVGNAFDSLAEGHVGSYALVGAVIGALALVAYMRTDKASSGFEDAVLPEASAPSAPWERSADATTQRALDSSRSAAATSVLATETPGGGE